MAGAGKQLPPLPRIPLPASLKKICPELDDWERQQDTANAEWLKKAVYNLQQP